MKRVLGTITLVFLLCPDASAQQDASAQLLQEVRLLRQAIESLVATGSRVQIVLGRLQLQEQRTASAVRRLDDLRETLARVSREAAEMSSRVQEIEEAQRTSRDTPEARANFETELLHTKRAAASMETERQRLQSEEALAAGALATEQMRWAELNQQLEDVERALAKRP